MSNVSVSEIVNVTISVEAVAPQAPGFSLPLIVGTSTKLPTYDRIRKYGPADVATDFAASDPEAIAAGVLFSQDPQPNYVLIGRRLAAASAGVLLGNNGSSTLADFTAVTNGGFDVTIDGSLEQIFALDLHLCANLAAVATALSAKLTAASTGSSCVWTGSRFVIISGTTGTSSTVTVTAAPTGGSSPADVGAIFGFTAAKAALPTTGVAAETDGGTAGAGIQTCLAHLRTLNSDWYAIGLTADHVADDNKGAMAYAEANKLAFFCTTQNSGCLDATVTSDLASYAKSNSYAHTFVQYSSTNPYAALSAMARALIVDFNQPNSTITLMFKQEPGVMPETLTPTQKAALDGKRCNYLATVSNGFTMIFNGITGSGRFFDEVMGLDWLKANLQNDVFTALATPATKIPQTDKGVQVLVKAMSKTLDLAVRNGLLAPGVWNGADLGEVESGDFLQKGYYIYAGPMSAQSTADRAARKAPPITALACGAGALHHVDITVNFQR
jgi:hypothetical protein